MLLIQAANIRHAHGGNQIFEDTGFEVREGDRLALVGPNGAGKSTLFRLMAKKITPNGGTVIHKRGVRIGMLDQDSTLDPEQTVRDVIALAAGDANALDAKLGELELKMAEPLTDDELTAVMDEYQEVLARLEEGKGAAGEGAPGLAILAGLRLPESMWDLPIGQLSGGQKKIVALARLLVESPDALLLDEPDNHLDLAAKHWLEGFLATWTGAVAMISHDRYFIDRVANEIFELEDGRIEVYPGNYSAFVTERQRRRDRAHQLREFEEREYKKLKETSEELTSWARMNPKFASRAENMRRRLAEERDRLDKSYVPGLYRKTIDLEFEAERGGTMVIEASGAAKKFDDRELIKPFEMVIRHGERVGIVGANGAGKTTLFRMLLGREPLSAGSVRFGSSVVPGYYAQEHETLDMRMTALDFVRKRKPWNEQQAIGFLSGLLFHRDDMLNSIGNLSGGEKARLQIAGLILEGSNLLLLDEPTNNLDIQSVEALEAALMDFTGTIVAISHDRFFLNTICTRIIEIDDGLVRDHQGNYASYEANPGLGALLTIGAHRMGEQKR